MAPVVKFALIDMACVAGIAFIIGLLIYFSTCLLEAIYANSKA